MVSKETLKKLSETSLPSGKVLAPLIQAHIYYTLVTVVYVQASY